MSRRFYGGEFFGGSDFVKLFVPMPEAVADEIVVDADGSCASDDEQGREFVVAAELLKQSSPVFASMLEENTWKESGAERIHLSHGFHPDDFRVFLESLAVIQPLSGAPINEVPQHELAVLTCRTPRFLRQVLPIAHYYQAALLKEAIFSSVLAEKSLCEMKPEDATELVFTTEASLPEDEVPDWPVSVLKLVLGRVLKSTTTPAPEVGRAVSDSKSGQILVKITSCDQRIMADEDPGDGARFSKPGLGEDAYKANTDGQLRLLVHYPGCPPFLVAINGSKTVGELKSQVVRELFAIVPTVNVRWLEDSQRHVLALGSSCSAVLADREKIFACSALDCTGPSGACLDNKVESSTNEVQRTTTATSSQRLHFDPRMKELSNKTIIKMMTSIDIKVTASIQVDAKAVAAVEVFHWKTYRNYHRVSIDSTLSKMTLLNELSHN